MAKRMTAQDLAQHVDPLGELVVCPVCHLMGTHSIEAVPGGDYAVRRCVFFPEHHVWAARELAPTGCGGDWSRTEWWTRPRRRNQAKDRDWGLSIMMVAMLAMWLATAVLMLLSRG